MRDLTLEDHGSLWLMRAHTPAGEEWVTDNVAVEHHFGGAAVIEPRYVADIASGAADHGLDVGFGR